MEYRLWSKAVTAAVVLHAAVWFALHYSTKPEVPRYLQFSVVEAQFVAAPNKLVGKPAAPKRKPRKQHNKIPHITKKYVVTKPRLTQQLPKPTKPVVSAPTPVAAREPYVEPNYGAAYLHNPPPLYPLMARRRGISGRVVIEAEVTIEGRCGAARVLHSSGHEILDDTALAAVKKWRFVPAARNGHPVTAWVVIPVNFKLQGES